MSLVVCFMQFYSKPQRLCAEAIAHRQIDRQANNTNSSREVNKKETAVLQSICCWFLVCHVAYHWNRCPINKYKLYSSQSPSDSNDKTSETNRKNTKTKTRFQLYLYIQAHCWLATDVVIFVRYWRESHWFKHNIPRFIVARVRQAWHGCETASECSCVCCALCVVHRAPSTDHTQLAMCKYYRKANVPMSADMIGPASNGIGLWCGIIIFDCWCDCVHTTCDCVCFVVVVDVCCLPGRTCSAAAATTW